MKVFSQPGFIQSAVAVVADKALTEFQKLSEKVSKRLEVAGQAYQAQCDLEQKILSAKIPDSPKANQIALSGFLVLLPSNKWLPLYSGKNHYKVLETPAGKSLTFHAGLSKDPTADILEINESLLVHRQGNDTKQLSTNHKIQLEGIDFVVKVLPPNHRRTVSYRNESEAAI